MPVSTTRRRVATALLPALALIGLAGAGAGPLAPPARADDHLPVLVGSFQAELGCAEDWAPACEATALPATETAGVFAAEFDVPAGDHEFKVALGGDWEDAYGVDGGETNFALPLAGETRLRFVFDDNVDRVGLEVLDLAGGYTPADDALVAEPARQAGAQEQFYFVMTDRFANGDPTNDTAGLGEDRLVSGFDPTDKGFYQGGDIAGLHSQLDYIEGLGTTAIWLTPSFANRPVQGEGANASAGYHGYWVTDFTRIDPHLGTNAELEALIDDAHDRGIKVYFDIITNHTADVISYTEGQYSYVDQETSPYRDADGAPFDPADYAGTGDFPALDPEVSFPYTPVANPEFQRTPAWLNDVTLYHNRGDSTWSGESVTYGDFSGLDDLMTEHPRVVDGFIDVYQDWIDLGIDGFRIDTAKHVNFEFWEEWSTEVLDHARAQGNEEFFMFGEVYDADARLLSPYVRETDMSSVLDFAFQSAAVNYAKGATAQALSALFASDDYYTTPTTTADALPTFLGNHDMGRVGFFLDGAGAELDRSMLAHSLMYLTRGQPVVYYGDEQGFVGAGGDKDARQSLFASQTEQYQQELTLYGEPIGSQDRFDTDVPLYTHIAELAELRSSTPALTTGAQVELHADEGAGVYAFARVDVDERVEHVVAVNNAAAARTVTFTTLTPGATYTSLYGDAGTVTAGADGALTLTVPGLEALVLVADETVGEPAAAGDVTLTPTPGAKVTGMVPVSADVADDVWAETSFAYRLVGEEDWTALGVAEGDAPRVFHDASDLPRGTLVEYRAVTEDAAGHRVAASTVGSVDQAVDLSVDEGPGQSELVTVPGSHNTEMGCTADWAPDCEAAVLTQRPDGAYSATFDLPAGSYEYKAAVGGTWDVSYGVGGVPGGANIAYTHAGGPITFYYDPITHVVTSSAEGPLITLPGSYQSEAGCPGDWQPDCLATWMQDVDGDGVYTWSTDALPTGAYEVKVAHNLGWAENYGAGGVLNGANISFSATEGKLVAFSYDISTHQLTIEVTDPPVAGAGQLGAHWLDATTIAWPTDLLGAADPDDLTWSLHHAPTGGITLADGTVSGGEEVTLTRVPSGIGEELAAAYPHLADHVALRVDGLDRETTERVLTGQLMVLQRGAGDVPTAFTGVQIPGVLDDLYAADAADRALGVTWAGGEPTLALWAPTAKDVDLLLWADGTGDGEPQRIAATREDDGSWTVEGAADWRDRAYRFAVEVYVPAEGEVVTNEVTDPYSVGLTRNSTHSVLLDLADEAWAPELWADTPAPVVERPVDRTIYELHVRDFSISDESVPEDLRGTYLAFAQPDSAGMTHLRELADAGMNTVHLLPTFDIATIEEDRAAQSEPVIPADAGPASEEQQAAVGAVADADGFNWGYDPWHFSTPEGSYATQPDGGARVAEFRTMVGGLHEAGLQVVVDEVYNHTSASGQAERSVLDRVVPGYYHRLSATGSVETSTCCENVATEHAMAGKLMVDSVVLWARDYRVDGFRFDLMGHHSRDNMLAVRAALDALTLEEDGVDGSAIYLYGEGWDFGEVAGNARFVQAKQGELGGTGIGTFSDRLRDAVHGGSPVDSSTIQQQGFGTGLYTDPNGAGYFPTPEAELADLQHQSDLVRLGLAGNLAGYSFLTADGEVRRGDEIDYRGAPAGYAEQPEEVITYVDAHDNETLFDLLTLKLPTDTTMAERVRMNTLSLATTALSQTPSFWHAGTDLLRSKSLDRNSYNSGDHFNRIDWTGQDNNFGVGLPPEADNGTHWELMRPLLSDPALKPTPQDIAASSAMAQDLLELRFSTELFRLGSADLIAQKVTFPGSGPEAAPGVVTMRVDDTVGEDVDPALDGLLVVFNATPESVTQAVTDLAGRELTLSPVQAAGADDVVRGTTWDAAAGTVTVPARTVAVLVEASAAPTPDPTDTPTETPTDPTATPTDPTTDPTDPTGPTGPTTDPSDPTGEPGDGAPGADGPGAPGGDMPVTGAGLGAAALGLLLLAAGAGLALAHRRRQLA
ncbi:pullulanase-type alpha-1,6-glucosidase [Georgenia faecalis]|uniref:pullulanase-type alpha-1,6-glucosidase n=1 Tax=Georgenia faecalis TaxID=2483799 RepID=UPI000FD902AF|nr:pullulanase-type alpha-1,6-glucosidase [Georgenia faecalis]